MNRNLEGIDIEKEMRRLPNKLRYTIELEALRHYPKNHTKLDEIQAVQKVFMQYFGPQLDGKGIYF